MTWLKTWLVTVTCAALIAALAEAMSPEGTPRRMVRLAGGLLLLLAILNPVRQLDPDRLEAVAAEYQTMHRADLDEMVAEAERNAKTIIAGETSAYILDKAAAVGLTECAVRVSCRMSESGFPIPDAVAVTGTGNQSAWQALSRVITEELAIPPERQTFERADVP